MPTPEENGSQLLMFSDEVAFPNVAEHPPISRRMLLEEGRDVGPAGGGGQTVAHLSEGKYIILSSYTAQQKFTSWAQFWCRR